MPAAIICVALSDPIRSALFGVDPVAAAWIAGDLLILWVTRLDAHIVESGSNCDVCDGSQVESDERHPEGCEQWGATDADRALG